MEFINARTLSREICRGPEKKIYLKGSSRYVWGKIFEFNSTAVLFVKFPKIPSFIILLSAQKSQHPHSSDQKSIVEVNLLYFCDISHRCEICL